MRNPDKKKKIDVWNSFTLCIAMIKIIWGMVESHFNVCEANDSEKNNLGKVWKVYYKK